MSESEASPDLFHLSTGVTLRLKRPSKQAVLHRKREFDADQPQPPQVWNDEDGVHRPNPNDPDYVAALEDHYSRGIEALYDTVVATGTEVVEVPPGMIPPESDEFLDFMGGLGIEASPYRSGRYIQWIKYIATTGDGDQSRLLALLMALMGTPEREVTEMVTLFWGFEKWIANNPVPDSAPGTYGDRLREIIAGIGKPL